MAAKSLESLTETLLESLEAANTTIPEPSKLRRPENGISLLDTKNELFLSYIQNLVFLILLKLRDARHSLNNSNSHNEEQSTNSATQSAVVGALVELRVYLERGVKPLENRLRYQIDKVVRAAEEASHKSSANSTINKSSRFTKNLQNGHTDSKEDESSGSEDSEAARLAHRPNPAAFSRPKNANTSKAATLTNATSEGVYQPPRISATMMPEGAPSKRDRTSRPHKSTTLDEFIATELSTAPIAEPSIGTTIRQGGRRSANTRERQEAHEREAYEEAHFVRLPKESKAERKKKSARDRNANWGGEDWRDLGGGADRVVNALTRARSAGDGSRVRQALERSRKRDHESGDADLDGGARMGEAFERSKRSWGNQAKKRRT